MWARASSLDDDALTSFVIEDDLVEVRAGSTAYGTISGSTLARPSAA
jgi:hypothetical protein